MRFDTRVPEQRDKSSRGVARRAKDLFRKTSGRPSVPDDDESALSVPRRPGDVPTRRELSHFDSDEED